MTRKPNKERLKATHWFKKNESSIEKVENEKDVKYIMIWIDETVSDFEGFIKELRDKGIEFTDICLAPSSSKTLINIFY